MASGSALKLLRPSLLALGALALTAGACSTSPRSPSATSSPTTSTTHPPRAGSVNLGFAGSTQLLNEQKIGPAFTAATGYAYQGQGGGAAAVAQFIKSGQYASTVFESIGGGPIGILEPSFTHYYVEFASSPLVIAYNPSGPFGSRLAAIAEGKKPIADLFTTMATNGFKLGRTDPNVDPQGQGFLLMVALAESQLHVSDTTVKALLANSQTFAETGLESVLQSGQLDAASAYLPQAVQMHLPYISLPNSINLGNPKDAARYATASITLTTPAGKVVTGTPLTLDVTTIDQPGESEVDKAASDAFVTYMLSPAGLAAYRAAGYTILTPTLYGSRSGIASSILSEVHAFVPGPAASPTARSTAG